MPDVSVVVPVHNEADNIQTLIEEITTALDSRFDYEVIYVDDGSRDATLERLQDALQRWPQLRVVRHLQCCGQSTAIWTGVEQARGIWIATLDGDGQNDPADIPGMLELAMRENDARLMVTGFRRKRKDTAWRRFWSDSANWILQRLLGYDTPDTGCGLKVLRRELFLKMPYFNHMHRFMPALVVRAGGRVVSVEVNHRPRARGQSKYGTWKRLVAVVIDLLGVMWLKLRSRMPVTQEVQRADSK